MTVVKICGITHPDDARCAVRAGADLLGFIFYPASPRYVAPPDAGRIVDTLLAEFGDHRPLVVGVFVDASVEAVRSVIHEAHLDLVQLHGTEPPSTVDALHPVAFKAIRPRTLQEAQAALQTYARMETGHQGSDTLPRLLVDTYHPYEKGGTGEKVDLTIARWLAARCPIILAGGLSPENVGVALADIRPWGVDVSSGVERAKGLKDHERLRAFVQAVRIAE
jgi:phosphoribosylanthranilate isomerase